MVSCTSYDAIDHNLKVHLVFSPHFYTNKNLVMTMQ